MKRILLPLITLVILFGGTSCSDFLDQPILGQNIDTPEYYNNEENARLALGGCYHTFAFHTKNCSFSWIYGDVRSDDAEKGGGGASDGLDIQYVKDWDVLATNSYCSGPWNASYSAIYATNTFIERMKKADFNEESITQYIAEAKFIRAYSYFLLVSYFGDVPLFTQPVDLNKLSNVKRDPFEAVLEQIEKDLTEIATVLPESYPATEVGRITSGAAKALHARVVMYSIGLFKVKPESAWKEVYDLTNDVIKSGMYNLHSNYAEIFELEGENCSESVLEFQFKTTKTGWGNNQGNPGDVFVGTKGGNNDGWGWGFNCPTQDLADEFELKDPRLYATIYGGEIAAYQYGLEEGVKKQPYNTGYASRKLALDPVNRPTEHSDGPSNVRVIRYSDVLLMKAEAAYHLSNEAETRALINQVRSRARTSSYPKGFLKDQNVYSPTGFINNLPDIPASVQGPALLKALKHERRVELAIEGLRYWDLARWGDYKETLSEEVKARFDKRHLRGVPVLPIPETEVVSWGLTQNPS